MKFELCRFQETAAVALTPCTIIRSITIISLSGYNSSKHKKRSGPAGPLLRVKCQSGYEFILSRSCSGGYDLPLITDGAYHILIESRPV